MNLGTDMAKQIEGISERILTCAKAEFLDKGYTDASLRVIAAAAETSTNSMYVRFGGKERLFSAIVEPALNEMTERFLKIQEAFHHMDRDAQAARMAEYADGGTAELVDYIYEHLDEFCLLLDASYGTRFHNFVDALVRIEVEYTAGSAALRYALTGQSRTAPQRFQRTAAFPSPGQRASSTAQTAAMTPPTALMAV